MGKEENRKKKRRKKIRHIQKIYKNSSSKDEILNKKASYTLKFIEIGSNYKTGK